MSKLNALRERKNDLAKKANNLLEKSGDKTWSKEEAAEYDGILDEMERLDTQIKAHQRAAEDDADKILAAAASTVGKGASPERQAFALFLRKAPQDLTPADVAQIRNAMSTTTPGEGGYTVPTEIATMVIDAVKAFGGMREVATVIRTDSGSDWNYPASDGTTEEGEIVGQNVAATSQDITFTSVALSTFRYSSKKLALPIELVQDSGIDIVAYVIDRLAKRLARITNKHFTIGTGSGQPFGIVPRATAGRVGTTGQTTSVIYDDLVDLQHAVDPGHRKGAKFMMNDASLKVIRKLKDSQNRPIFVPGYEMGPPGGIPDSLLGSPVVVNQDVAVMAANAKSIVFGDLTTYTIRDVFGADVKRFDDSAFALNGQVGFCGFQRTGGNLLDTAAVKYYQNSAT